MMEETRDLLNLKAIFPPIVSAIGFSVYFSLEGCLMSLVRSGGPPDQFHQGLRSDSRFPSVLPTKPYGFGSIVARNAMI